MIKSIQSELELSDEKLKIICQRLIEKDPDIIEIVQFGSSIYAPEMARDLDLMVFTKKGKGHEAYLDSVAEIYDKESISFNIDIVPYEIGEIVNERLAIQARGAYKVLYGNGEIFFRATENAIKQISMDPKIKDARVALKAAQEYMHLALNTKDDLLRDRHVRNAFDSLFHAARMASMVYLSTEETRWGKIRGFLPKPYKDLFEKIIMVLHIEYFYRGNYPKQDIKKEFNYWLKKVKDYVRKIEEEKR